MKHIVLLLYILLFSTGFAGLFCIIMLHRKYTERGILPFILLQIIFMVSLALVFIYYYLNRILNLSGTADTVSVSFGMVLTLLQIAMLLLLARMCAPLPLLPKLAKGVVILLAITILASAGSLLTNLVSSNQFLTRFFRIAVYTAVPISLGSTGWLFTRQKYDENVLTLLYQGIGWSLVLFVPLGILEAVFAFSSLDPFSMEYITYLGCNLVYILAAVTAYRNSGKEEENLTEQIELLRKHYALTNREAEMIPFIAAGLTNKEIGWELGISEATIRTHIYNLYQKLGVQSRISLLNLLRRPQ